MVQASKALSVSQSRYTLHVTGVDINADTVDAE